MSAIIAYRIGDGPIEMVLGESESVCEFINYSTADEYAKNNALFQSGQAEYQIIELDEI